MDDMLNDIQVIRVGQENLIEEKEQLKKEICELRAKCCSLEERLRKMYEEMKYCGQLLTEAQEKARTLENEKETMQTQFMYNAHEFRKQLSILQNCNCTLAKENDSLVANTKKHLCNLMKCQKELHETHERNAGLRNYVKEIEENNANNANKYKKINEKLCLENECLRQKLKEVHDKLTAKTNHRNDLELNSAHAYTQHCGGQSRRVQSRRGQSRKDQSRKGQSQKGESRKGQSRIGQSRRSLSQKVKCMKKSKRFSDFQLDPKSQRIARINSRQSEHNGRNGQYQHCVDICCRVKPSDLGQHSMYVNQSRHSLHDSSNKNDPTSKTVHEDLTSQRSSKYNLNTSKEELYHQDLSQRKHSIHTKSESHGMDTEKVNDEKSIHRSTVNVHQTDLKQKPHEKTEDIKPEQTNPMHKRVCFVASDKLTRNRRIDDGASSTRKKSCCECNNQQSSRLQEIVRNNSSRVSSSQSNDHQKKCKSRLRRRKCLIM